MSGEKIMDKDRFMLAAMSPAGTGFFTPVQVQKMFFLLDMNISDETEGEQFDFVAYDYGPFDVDVYIELEELEDEGLVEIQDLYPNPFSQKIPTSQTKVFVKAKKFLKNFQIIFKNISARSLNSFALCLLPNW